MLWGLFTSRPILCNSAPTFWTWTKTQMQLWMNQPRVQHLSVLEHWTTEEEYTRSCVNDKKVTSVVATLVKGQRKEKTLGTVMWVKWIKARIQRNSNSMELKHRCHRTHNLSHHLLYGYQKNCCPSSNCFKGDSPISLLTNSRDQLERFPSTPFLHKRCSAINWTYLFARRYWLPVSGRKSLVST